MEKKDDIILTTQEEIREFLEWKGKFSHDFNLTDYNAKITIRGVRGWEKRYFYVCNVIDNKNYIVDGIIKIVSENDYPVNEGIVEYVSPNNDGRSVYRVKVSEIEEIELVKIPE